MGGVAIEQQRPRLRADASRNRERIVTAAREALVEHGPDIPLDEVARRAGVGNATLYRHFADRTQLIRTVTLSVMDRVARRAEAALDEEPDAFEALRRFTHEAADERIGALCTLLSGAFEEGDPELVSAGDHLATAVQALVAGAHRSGQLRTDVAVGDLMVALSQLTRPLPGTSCFNTDRFAHRHLQLFLDGLRTPARSELPGSAVTFEDLQQKKS